MSHKYVDFISDDDFLNVINNVYSVYKEKAQGFTIDEFYKNTIDPFRIHMDTIFQDIPIDEYLKREMNRKIEKSISNAVGSFHEQLLGSIKGFKRYPVGDPNGEGVDIANTKKTIWAEVKNKHNTVKGENSKDIYKKLEKIADKYPESNVYYVRILDTKSRNQQWKIPKHNLDHPHVHIISGDQFYSLVTGDPDAFKKLLTAFPIALKDYVQNLEDEEKISNGSNMLFYSTLVDKAIKSKQSEQSFDQQWIVDQMIEDNFPTYLGFDNHPSI